VNRLPTVLKVLVGLACILGAGILVGWWGTGGALKSAAAPPANTTAAAPEPTPPVVPPANASALPQPPRRANPKPAMQPRVASAPQNPTKWRDRVDAILSSEEDPNLKAGQMLQLLPRLPQEGQVEVVQYASDLLPDTNYWAVGMYLTATNTPEQVRDVLLAGLLQRPDSIKLPYLLAMARDQANPQAGQARLYLSSFLDQDYGHDWARWQAGVEQRVRDNPD
jgi:hypothetical protein